MFLLQYRTYESQGQDEIIEKHQKPLQIEKGCYLNVKSYLLRADERSSEENFMLHWKKTRHEKPILKESVKNKIGIAGNSKGICFKKTGNQEKDKETDGRSRYYVENRIWILSNKFFIL